MQYKKNNKLFKSVRSNPDIILVLSFVSIILLGSVLLMLPFSSHTQPLSFMNSLFTATSATCVTGLNVVDIGSQFTPLGQIIILILIQLGGLGIITFSTAFLYLIDSKLSMTNRDILNETINQGPTLNMKNILKTIIVSTFAIESIGAFILFIRFMFDMPVKEAVFSAIFHSVSAFCNAGFSIYPDSFSRYQSDFIVNSTLMILIILGSLGFVVIYELANYKLGKNKTISFYSKIILITTGFLILSGAVLFFILEYSNILSDKPLGTKILISLFQSITTRTAGFNTIDIRLLTNPTLFIISILMFIGAGSASCGGGIKVGTFAVLVAFIKTRFNNQTHVHLFDRHIPPQTVSKAISVTIFSILAIGTFLLVILITESTGISHIESRGMFLEMMFEITSAFATVGLSTGLTATLSSLGQITLIILMLIGRLGPLTIAMSISKKEKQLFKYMEAKVLIG